MSWISDALWVIAHPGCWVRNRPTSKALSEFIDNRLDAGDKPEIIGDYTMRLGGVVLWRGNYAYAYGSVFGRVFDSRVGVENLPSRRVAARLRTAEISVLGTDESRIRAYLARFDVQPHPADGADQAVPGSDDLEEIA